MESGTRLGPYEILELLGKGGMGEVWLAVDSRLGRKVAIKTLPPEFALEPERVARFEQEARAAAALNHPNIAAVFDVGEHDAGMRFIVQEYLEGQSLRDLLRDNPPKLVRALTIGVEVAQALATAHSAGIVHRDIKPDNIFVLDSGLVKVLDFGLAKLVDPGTFAGDSADSAPTAIGTMAGAVMGTAGYMAPEQVEGREIDARADLFAFGCVLYEMVSGKKPFRGQNVHETLARIVSSEPELLQPEIAPPELQRILRKCLAKDPAERAQSAGDLVVDLRRLARDVESGANEAASGAMTMQAPEVADRRHGVAPAIVVAVTLAALLTGALGVRLMADDPVVDRQIIELDIGLAGAMLDETFGPGAMLSPDGRWIAMAVEGADTVGRERESRAGLALRSLSSGAVEWLVDYPIDNPVFSPDSHSLAYEQDGVLWKIPVAGGVPIHLTETFTDRGVAWLSDGSILIVPTAADGIFRLPAAGGELIPVTTLAEGEASHRWPQVLPGEGHVLFTADLDGLDWTDATIEVADLATGERQVVLRGGYFPRYVETGHILYANGSTLHALPFDLDRLEATGPAFRVLEGLSSNPAVGAAQFSLADDGTLLYLPGDDASNILRLIVTDRAGEPAQLGNSDLTEEGLEGLVLGPTVSPDGTRVAYVRSTSSGKGDIWIHDAGRGLSSRLTLSTQIESFPVWSRDGKQIYYCLCAGSADEAGVYRRNADGSGDAERILAGSQWRPWDVHPDGRMLIVGKDIQVSFSAQRGLYEFDLESGGELRLIPNTDIGLSFQARISPDGRWLVYTGTYTSGVPDVYVVALEGDGRWQISDQGGAQPMFSNDGSEIFYRSARRVISVSIAPEGNALRPGRPRTLFQSREGSTLGVPFGGSYQYDYSTLDGQRFVQVAGQLTQNEGHEKRGILVLNWFERLRRMASAQD